MTPPTPPRPPTAPAMITWWNALMQREHGAAPCTPFSLLDYEEERDDLNAEITRHLDTNPVLAAEQALFLTHLHTEIAACIARMRAAEHTTD